ncbi:MAG: ester cyclase [Chloroflexi bacterium]|jgi:hypothetical protein|nr:ester cyclase [Chloroflexota bacterium]
MLDPGASQSGADGAPVTLMLPLRPGQSEAWRRVIQELQESRCADFDAACRRWGIRKLALWLAPARPGDLVVVQVELSGALTDAEERFARSQQPFDQWITERVRELHGLDLRIGFARYRAELVGVWPETQKPVESH